MFVCMSFSIIAPLLCLSYPLHSLWLSPPPFAPSLTFSQRWVSEKLSVESLRDLELFGGEFNSSSDVDVLLVPLSANPPA